MAYRYLVSACLAGRACRYDGGSNPVDRVIRLVEQGQALPVCPEELGGLPTPRVPCERQGSRIVSRDGHDMTAAFARGAEQAWQQARQAGCTEAVLKARSPSCGLGRIHDGTFSGRLVPGHGVLAVKLLRSGLRLHTEETFDPESPGSIASHREGRMGTGKNGLETLWDIRLEEVAQSLRARYFTVDIFQNCSEAVTFFRDSIISSLKPASASVGGSETVRLAGLYDILRQSLGEKFLDPAAPGITPEERLEIRRQSQLVDLYLTSTNALTRDGRLLNLDGTGNRVASMHFGPRHVVLFVGRNKICEDLEGARQRVKEVASPANCIRLERKTPCTTTGTCMECKSPDRICNVWTLTEYSSPPGRIHILLINEDLGF